MSICSRQTELVNNACNSNVRNLITWLGFLQKLRFQTVRSMWKLRCVSLLYINRGRRNKFSKPNHVVRRTLLNFHQKLCTFFVHNKETSEEAVAKYYDFISGLPETRNPQSEKFSRNHTTAVNLTNVRQTSYIVEFANKTHVCLKPNYHFMSGISRLTYRQKRRQTYRFHYCCMINFSFKLIAFF